MTATARSSTLRPATVQFSGARRALALIITRTPPACTFIVGVPSPWYNSALPAAACTAVPGLAAASFCSRAPARRRRMCSTVSTTTDATQARMPVAPYQGSGELALWCSTGFEVSTTPVRNAAVTSPRCTRLHSQRSSLLTCVLMRELK